MLTSVLKMTMNPIKFPNLLLAVAAALALCGCPDSSEEDVSPTAAPGAPAVAQPPAQPAPPPIPASFDNPKVNARATVALAYQPSASGTLRQVMDAVRGAFRRDVRRGAELGDMLALDRFLDAARFESPEVAVQWMLLSADGLRLGDGAIDGVPRTSCALAYPHDLSAIVAKVRDGAKDCPTLRVTQSAAAGIPCWEIVDESLARDPVLKDVRLTVASLGGRLLILATSKEVLAEQIALYRDGCGENAAFNAVAEGKRAAARLFIPSVGGLVDASLQVGEGGVKPLEGFMADGVRVFREMGELDLSVAAKESSEDLQVELRAVAGSATDAEALRASVRAALVPLVVRYGMTADLKDGRSKQILRMLKSAVVGGEESVVRVTMTVNKEVVDLVVDGLGENAGLMTGGASDLAK